MRLPNLKFCVRSRAAFAPNVEGKAAGVSTEVVRLAAKREHGSVDTHDDLSLFGNSEGGRSEPQNCFVFGELLFEQSSKKNIINFLATEPSFTGIGNVRATKLVEAFGASLLDKILFKSPEVMEYLPEEVAINLFENFQDAAASAELAMFLDTLGVGKWVGRLIVRSWGQLGAEKLKENPYLLVSWINWKNVDDIGRKLNIQEDDPRRLCAAVESVVYRRLDRGHTWISRKKLAFEVSKIVGEKLSETAINIAHDHNGIIALDEGYQPVGAAVMERWLLKRANQNLDGQADMFTAVKLTKTELINELAYVENQQGFRFTDAQVDAILAVLNSDFSTIAGYAGSGKTSVLKAVCYIAEKYGRTVHLMALAGRAAKRITEATGYPASTIYKFIKDNLGKVLDNSNLILIDEASMVDLADIYRVIRICGDAQISMFGDPAQLPPIGFGAPFSDLVQIDNVTKVILDKVHRQDETTGIPTIAENIRNGIVTELNGFWGLGKGVFFYDANEDEAPEIIKKIGKSFRIAGADKDETQIIAPVKRGAGGVNNINKYLSDLAPNRETMLLRSDIRVGDPIVYLKQDYDRGLRNGSLGRLTANNKAIFEGEEITLDYSDADNVDLAYCLTVHKAQGSQWRRVIVPMFNNSGSSFVERSMIYTAITRASEQVIIVGDFEAFASAVSSETAANKRDTGVRKYG